MVEKIYLMGKEPFTIAVHVSEELLKIRLQYNVIGLDYLQHVLW